MRKSRAKIYFEFDRIFSFQESLDSWMSFFTFPNDLGCPLVIQAVTVVTQVTRD